MQVQGEVGEEHPGIKHEQQELVQFDEMRRTGDIGELVHWMLVGANNFLGCGKRRSCG